LTNSSGQSITGLSSSSRWGTAALLSAGGVVCFETLPSVYPLALIQGILITGMVATGLALYVLNRFQEHSTATYTAIILIMEPVFAGLFGFLLLGESLSKMQILGGVLIVSGMMLPQITKEFIPTSHFVKLKQKDKRHASQRN
jgi:drug/metabolite transporter (DMT)-like permease